MKTSELKQILKEACKEAFREELKEILLEAIKSPKNVVQESRQFVRESKQNVEEEQVGNPRDVRSSYKSLMENMGGGQNMQQNSMQKLGPIPMNTISEGSSLPSGEVPMDLIMNLTKPK